MWMRTMYLPFQRLTIPSWMTYLDQAAILIGRPDESNLGKSLVAFEVSDGKDATQLIYYITVAPASGMAELMQTRRNHYCILILPVPFSPCFPV